MTVNIHKESGKPKSVTMSYSDYQNLLERQEELEMIIRAGIIKARIESGEEEVFPSEIVNRIFIDEENPIRVFREYRKMTQ